MKRGLASPCVHSALATTRRSRDQLSSVDHGNSLKRRAGFDRERARCGQERSVGRYRDRHERRRPALGRQLPPPAIQQAHVDARVARDLRHDRGRLTHRRHKPGLLRRAPATTSLNRRDDLNAIRNALG